MNFVVCGKIGDLFQPNLEFDDLNDIFPIYIGCLIITLSKG